MQGQEQTTFVNTFGFINAFRRRVIEGTHLGITIRYQTEVGTQQERAVEELMLSGDGRAKFSKHRFIQPSEPTELTIDLDKKGISSLLEKISLALESLTPQSQGPFLPDSAIETITVDVDGKSQRFFFLSAPRDREIQNKHIPEQAMEAIRELRRVVGTAR
jgi:hypothetical protein